MVELKVTLPQPLHLRPAAMLVAAAGRFAANVRLGYNGTYVGTESVMRVLALQAPAGALVTVHANGPDAMQAALAVAERLRDAAPERPWWE